MIFYFNSGKSLKMNVDEWSHPCNNDVGNGMTGWRGEETARFVVFWLNLPLTLILDFDIDIHAALHLLTNYASLNQITFKQIFLLSHFMDDSAALENVPAVLHIPHRTYFKLKTSEWVMCDW